MQVTTAETKIRRGLDTLMERFPYFTGIAARWTVKELNSIPTMTTDGPTLMWNRSFVDQLTHDEVAWVILHEAGHIFLGHHLRFSGKPAAEWNTAADLALNDLIRQSASDRLRGLACIPGVGQFAEMPTGKDAEWYFDHTRQPEQPEQEQEGGKDEQDDPKDEPEGSDDGDTAPEGDDASESQPDGQEGDSDQTGDSEQESEGGEDGETAEGGEGGEDGGSEGADAENGSEAASEAGAGQPTKLGDLKPGDVGQILEAPEAVEGEPSEEEAWKQAVVDGVNAARIAGNLPGRIEHLARSLYGKARTLTWKDLLARFMQEIAKSCLSYARPNRRTAWRGDIILPSRFSRDAGKGVVLVDTSGSMNEADLNVALREVENILASFPDAQVTMMQCDTEVIDRAERKFNKADFPMKAPATWFGRGGTDMNPALKRIAMRRAEFAWCIVVTDGGWAMSEAIDTGLPTIYLITPGHHACGTPRNGFVLDMTK